MNIFKVAFGWYNCLEASRTSVHPNFISAVKDTISFLQVSLLFEVDLCMSSFGALSVFETGDIKWEQKQGAVLNLGQE